jgi:hypothetical protein
MTAPVDATRNQARVLGIIRIAILVGVLAFGAAIWFLQSRAGWHASLSPHDRGLRLMLRIAWLIGVLGVLACFFVASSPKLAWRVPMLPVIGWALGELPALAGAVHYLQTGDRQWYTWGVGALLITYFIFPIRTARR